MSHETTQALGRPQTLSEGWQALPGQVDDWHEGLQLGPFRLKRRLGQGGMGLVWLADQLSPLRREVAIKVMRAERQGPIAEAWFEVERQALAQLSHRAIAQIYDAGRLPDGALFFAMEYVSGLPFDEYLRQHQPGPKELARLLIEVCAGVQHAHQRGLIHRDLKPLNILVATGDGPAQPKIIDFGIAISSGGVPGGSSPTRIAGTASYMSPEQKQPGPEGVDARTDVYALGAVLAEALCLGAGWSRSETDIDSTVLRDILNHSLARSEASTDQAGASTPLLSDVAALARISAQPAELRAIAVKAMATAREQRYDSAAAMAEELQRWLRHEPVQAMAGGRSYRVRCFLRRHAWPSAVAALLAVALIAFAITASLQALRIGREAARANAALAELEQVSNFQASQLSAIDAAAMGERLKADILRRHAEAGGDQAAIGAVLEAVNFTDVALTSLDQSILEQAIASIGRDFADRPALRARLLQSVAVTLLDLGLLERAQSVQTEALALRQQHLGPRDPATLESLNWMATILQNQGQLAEAEAPFREALEGRRAVLGDEHPDTIDSISNLGLLLHLTGRFADAEALYLEALEKYRRVRGPEHAYTLQALNNLGGLKRDQGKLGEAEGYWREALAIRRRQLGDDHPETLMSINNLSALLRDQGQFDASLALAEEVVERASRVLGAEHPTTLGYLSNLGTLYTNLQRMGDADRVLGQVYAATRSTLGERHPNLANVAANWGALKRRQGELDRAIELVRESLSIRQAVLGPAHPNTLIVQGNLGDFLREQGDVAGAIDMLEEALAHGRQSLSQNLSDRLVLIELRLARALLESRDAGSKARASELLASAKRGLQAQAEPHPADLELLATVQALAKEAP